VRNILLSAAVGLAILTAGISAEASTIIVPDDQPTIQAGILAASDGDTVLVKPGTYVEIIDYSGHSVFVKSEKGPDSTLLQPTNADSSTVIAANAEDSPAGLEGFTISGTNHASTLYLECANFLVTGNVFHDNIPSVINPLTVIRAAGPCTIKYNTFYRNQGINTIFCSDSCRIINNTLDSNARGVYTTSPKAVLVNNIIAHCGDYYVIGDFAYADYNDIWPSPALASMGSHGFSADPSFQDPSVYDYSLSQLSPCLEAGSPDSSYPGLSGGQADIGSKSYGGSSSPPFATGVRTETLDLLHTLSISPLFSWHFYHPGHVQTGYDVVVSSEAAPEIWSVTQPTSSDSTVQYNGPDLDTGATYIMDIRLQDDSGWGPWIAHPFRINSPPPAPSIIYPGAGATVSSKSVEMAVENVMDPEGDTVRYEFRIYSDPSLTNLAYSVSNIKKEPRYTRSPICTSLVADQPYWWTCTAYDPYGGASVTPATQIVTHESFVRLDVPAMYPFIQAAIDNSADGDTILLTPGVYTENLDLGNRKIVLRPSGGRENTFLEPYSQNGNVIRIASFNDTLPLVEDLTVRGTRGASGIYSLSGGVILRCDIFDCRGINGGGILSQNTRSHIVDCDIHDNVATSTGGGVDINSSILENCRIYNNQAPTGSGVYVSGSAKVRRNFIYGNTGSGDFAAGITVRSTYGYINYIYNNTIVDNSRGMVIQFSGLTYTNNNIIAYNQLYGLNTNGEGQVFPDYNDLYANGGGDDQFQFHGLSADPMFVDTSARNYSLNISSPCIDMGKPDTANLDPDGTPPDLGAIPFEFDQPVAVDINVGDGNIWRVVASDPTFHWSFHDSLGRTQTSFELEAGSDITTDIPDMWLPGMIDTADSSVTYDFDGTAEPLIEGHTYYLRIRVAANGDFGDWHYARFHIDEPPTVPVPIAPIEGALVSTAGIALVADTASDLEHDTLVYNFEIYSDTTADTPSAATSRKIALGTFPASSGIISGLQADSLYYWRVRTFDGYKYSGWSRFQTFRTQDENLRRLVPDDYATIQDAIDIASAGDTIVVAAGTYSGDGNRDLNMEGKSGLVFLAPGGNQATTLDLQGDASEPHRLFERHLSAEHDFVFEGFTIENGYAHQGGVVQGNQGTALVTFTDCIFHNNHADFGGVISRSSITLKYCSFEANSADSAGGVLYATWGNAQSCLFLNNSADLYGGVASAAADMVYDSCDFAGNSALSGSMIDGYAINTNTLNNCLIAENHGAVFDVVATSIVLDHCTIVNNDGPVLLLQDAGASLSECIGAFNGGAVAECLLNFPDPIHYGTVRATNSCFFGNGNPGGDCTLKWVDTLGNISADPAFCNLTTDYRLQTNSPCVMAGSEGGPIGARPVGCQTIDVEDDNPPVTYTFELSHNYPNPFNPSTVIRYALGRRSDVRLTIYNLLGQVVKQLVNESQAAGEYRITWNGDNSSGRSVASGVYFYRLEAGEFTASEKMILLK